MKNDLRDPAENEKSGRELRLRRAHRNITLCAACGCVLGRMTPLGEYLRSRIEGGSECWLRDLEALCREILSSSERARTPPGRASAQLRAFLVHTCCVPLGEAFDMSEAMYAHYRDIGLQEELTDDTTGSTTSGSGGLSGPSFNSSTNSSLNDRAIVEYNCGRFDSAQLLWHRAQVAHCPLSPSMSPSPSLSLTSPSFSSSFLPSSPHRPPPPPPLTGARH